MSVQAAPLLLTERVDRPSGGMDRRTSRLLWLAFDLTVFGGLILFLG